MNEHRLGVSCGAALFGGPPLLAAYAGMALSERPVGHTSSAASPFRQWSVDSGYPDAFCEAQEPESLDLNPRQVKLIPSESVAR